MGTVVFRIFMLVLLCVSVQACTAESSAVPPQAFTVAYESDGPYPSGNTTIRFVDATRADRVLPTEVWYPAADAARSVAEQGESVLNFATEGTTAEILALLLDAAPENGPTRQTGSARDAAIATTDSAWPIVFFSHCMNCNRWSTLSIAERLASHGFIVVAPDHTGGTVYESVTSDTADLGTEFLDVRASDMRFLMDRMLDPGAADVPAFLRGQSDAQRVGIYGHSFGGATAGRVLNLDDRPKAGLALAVPMESPLFTGVSMSEIAVPLFFLLAREDNMIFEIGNLYIRENFEDAEVPVWMAEVTDAGHMSFTDICKITVTHHAGCGEGKRHEDAAPFSYIDQGTGIAIAQAYTTAFFAAHLRQEPAARRYLSVPRPAAYVSAVSRNTD